MRFHSEITFLFQVLGIFIFHRRTLYSFLFKRCHGIYPNGSFFFFNITTNHHHAIPIAISFKGSDCEIDINGCSADPCAAYRGAGCVDHTPEEVANHGHEYSCTQCPSGFSQYQGLGPCQGKSLTETMSNLVINLHVSDIVAQSFAYRQIN